MMAKEPNQRAEEPLLAKIDRLEAAATELVKEMGHRLGSIDANDSGPAVCAIWNLGAAARRLARILEDSRQRLNRA